MTPAPPPSPAVDAIDGGPAEDRAELSTGLPSPPDAPITPTRSVSWLKVGAMGAVALAGCAYLAFFDPSTSSAIYPQCPFKAVTGFDCPGCGTTRAMHSLLTGDVGRALDHNALFVLALPVLLWWAIRGAVRSTGRKPPGPGLRWRPWMTWTLVSLVGVFWVVRNLPWGPFDWLFSGVS